MAQMFSKQEGRCLLFPVCYEEVICGLFKVPRMKKLPF